MRRSKEAQEQAEKQENDISKRTRKGNQLTFGATVHTDLPPFLCRCYFGLGLNSGDYLSTSVTMTLEPQW